MDSIMLNNKKNFIENLNLEENLIKENEFLHYISKYNYINFLKIFLKKCNNKDLFINHQNELGKTPLYIACEYENYDIIKLLLKNNANPNIYEFNEKNTPLLISCEKNNIKIVKRLLKNKNININHQNNLNKTALHISCKYNNRELIGLLLDYNIDYKIKDYLNLEAQYHIFIYNNLNLFLEFFYREIELDFFNYKYFFNNLDYEKHQELIYYIFSNEKLPIDNLTENQKEKINNIFLQYRKKSAKK